jgi:uncharacterized protein YrrD/ElaB/YqjD/DUF883 family membrane-anchored ribosome-binding protein
MVVADNDPMRQSRLHNRLVIDLETTEELGRLAQFLVDGKHHQVEGFLCKKGMLGLEKTPVMWVQVESVGQDSILVRRSGNAISERIDEAIALERQAIWSDSGDQVGQLVDYCLDLKTGAITQYLFTAPGWQGLTDGLYTFSPEAVISMGRKRLMVHHAALANAPQFVPGLHDRVADVWQQDVKQTRQDLQGAIDSTREVTDQVQEQAKKLTEQAKSQFGQVFGQVKQQSKRLRSQVNDRFADAAANLQNPKSRHQHQVSGTTIDVDSTDVDEEEIWPDEESPS